MPPPLARHPAGPVPGPGLAALTCEVGTGLLHTLGGGESEDTRHMVRKQNTARIGRLTNESCLHCPLGRSAC